MGRGQQVRDPEVRRMGRIAGVIQNAFVNGTNDDGSERIYYEMIRDLDAAESASRWVLGDAISEAKRKFGAMEAYRRTAEALGATVRWALELAKVAETFGPEVRRAGLSWNVYRACAQTDDPLGMLTEAVDRGLSAADIRRSIGRPHAKDLVQDPAVERLF